MIAMLELTSLHLPVLNCSFPSKVTPILLYFLLISKACLIDLIHQMLNPLILITLICFSFQSIQNIFILFPANILNTILRFIIPQPLQQASPLTIFKKTKGY